MVLDPKYAKELREALDAQPSLSWLDRNRENPGHEAV